MRYTHAVAALTLSAPIAAAHAGQIDPRGIFFNEFSGSFSGTEWFQTIPSGNNYILADIFGGGFTASITPDGVINLLGNPGGGSFSTPDDYIITPFIGGTNFTFDNNRAPFTTPDFPLQLTSATQGPSVFAGAFSSLTQQWNPQTGQLLGGGFENVNITLTGNSFRITDPQGLFFQGTFETPVHAGFRVVVPTPSPIAFRTFQGSATNTNLNILGEARLIDVNTFEATVLAQTRTPLGQQDQFLFTFNATRINPLAPGDLNGDGTIDEDDRAILLAQVGLNSDQDGFNIAADLVADGAIDQLDVDAFNEILPPCTGDLTGDQMVDSSDLNALLAVFGLALENGDVDGDGDTDSVDLNLLLANFGTDCTQG